MDPQEYRAPEAGAVVEYYERLQFVGSYYDMGTNVPNIYQVPELARNLPPGMPGDKPIISLKRKTWRERIPTEG